MRIKNIFSTSVLSCSSKTYTKAGTFSVSFQLLAIDDHCVFTCILISDPGIFHVWKFVCVEYISEFFNLGQNLVENLSCNMFFVHIMSTTLDEDDSKTLREHIYKLGVIF